jgi:hypothetical protein
MSPPKGVWLANCYFSKDSSGFSVLLDYLMRNLAVLFIHFIAVLARLLRPGGVRSLVAESLLLKHQILILNRFRMLDCRQPFPYRIMEG